MRLTTSHAAPVALAALLLAACNPHDSSAPAANGGAATKAANANAAPPDGAVGPQRAATPQQPAATPRAAAATPPPADGIRRVTVQEAHAAADAGQAIIYDVRNQASFATGHIKGARLVAYDEVDKHLSEFPKDKLIITYCA